MGVTERDDYKMPPLFTGEYTPEVRKQIAENKKDVEKRKAKLMEVYRERKAEKVVDSEQILLMQIIELF